MEAHLEKMALAVCIRAICTYQGMVIISVNQRIPTYSRRQSADSLDRLL